MRKEPKVGKQKYDVTENSAAKRKRVMSSNLPLLMAKGRPRSLDTILQSELENFVPFMILCSLGSEQHKKPFKEINNCPVPEWWPQGFPFKYPLVEQSHWTDRQVMLKSLVCRCYTYYNCEFLLKFSAQLADMPHIKFRENKNENTTSIYDVDNELMVKCRNENLNYDLHKNHRRFLAPSPARPSLGSSKKFSPVIDLTFETSSEDEKEVYFKEQKTASVAGKSCGKRKPSFELSEEPAGKQRCLRRFQDFSKEEPEPQVYNEQKTASVAGKSCGKRKPSFELSEEPAGKQRCLRRFQDFSKEEPEPQVYNEDQFMIKFGLVRAGQQMPTVEQKEDFNYSKDRKKRLARCFNLLSITSTRGQELLKRNRNAANLEACLERVERYTSPVTQVTAVESDHVATRASLNYGFVLDYSDIQEDAELKWCHTYKWPHRTRKPAYLHRGPSIHPCSVQLERLSQEVIAYWTSNKRNKATSTPPVWWMHNRPICECLKIPLIDLDDDSTDERKDKSSSTRCICTVPQMPKLHPIPQQTPPRLFSNPRVKLQPPTLIQINPDYQPNSSPGSTRVITPFSRGDGTTLTLFNTSHQSGTRVNLKRALHRIPLAVVSPSTVEPSDSVPSHSLTLSLLKISFYRSIVDAIKWYTKEEDLVISSGEFSTDHHFESRGFARERGHTQENIKPLSPIVDLKTSKVVNFFKVNIDTNNRDLCYTTLSEDVQSKVVTRRGIRLYLNREPCPSCFQGQDNVCVYEFIRQAKLAGVPLRNNEKRLHQIFLEFVQKLSCN